MDALKSSDWTTRKAASLALSSIAVSSGYLVASFRTSCLRSLERSKFDKVKPVRDAITHAIQLWKAIPGSHTPEPSEAGSSTKENFFGDNHDARSIHDGGSRDTSFRRIDHGPSASVNSSSSINSAKRRSPLSINKIALNNAANQQRLKSGDWHVEVSVPKQNMMPLVDIDEKGSSKVCTLKDAKRNAYEIVDEDSKRNAYEIDSVPLMNWPMLGSNFKRWRGGNQIFFYLLKEFMSNSVENMSVLNLKVHNLENAVDKTVYTITQSESRYHLPGSKFFKNQSVSSSPRLSTSTPRSSVDANYKPPPISYLKHEKKWMHDLPSTGSNLCTKEGAGFVKDHAHTRVRKPGPMSSESNLGRYAPSSARS